MSQETVTASSSVTTLTAYDLTMTTNLPDPHLDMKPTETFFFEALIYSTNPATNLEFEIGELLGDVDALHFGRPVVTFGSSFRFTQSGPSDDPYNQVMYLKTDNITNQMIAVREADSITLRRHPPVLASRSGSGDGG